MELAVREMDAGIEDLQAGEGVARKITRISQLMEVNTQATASAN